MGNIRAFGRYTPLLIVLAVQALLVVSAPAPHSSNVATYGGSGSSGGVSSSGVNSGAAGATGGAGGGTLAGGGGSSGGVTSSGGGGSSGQVGGGTSSGGGGGSTAGGGGGGGSTGGGVVNSTGSALACRQIKPLVTYQPSCEPVWSGGNNGGATMTGVTATQIHYVYYAVQANAEVDAVLQRENLAATPEQNCESIRAFNAEVNKRWQLYGRQIVPMDGPGNYAGSKQQSPCNFPYFQSACTSSPPDQACYRAEADQVAAMKPAFVIAITADTSFVYRLAEDHIVVITGELVPEQYYEQLAPYVWGPGNGTESAYMFAQFYCAALADKPVQFAGPDIQGTGLSAAPSRKLAISYPENGGDKTYQLSADLLQSLVSGGMCGHKGDAITASYTSDITTAQQQSDTYVATLKSNHITSASCFCDPISPVFATNTEEEQNYHPEQIITGTLLLDYDVLAQLYNQDIWRHTFGISDLANAAPFATSDAVKAWNDAGNSGQPDATENLNLFFYEFLGDMIQASGPVLNTTNMHNGLLALPEMGGSPTESGLKFTPQYPYSSFIDVREVWYCPTQTSPINNQPGAYVPLNGGARLHLGQFGSSTSGFFPNGLCAP